MNEYQHIDRTVIGNRIERIREDIHLQELDGLLVLVGENRFYLSGYTGEDSQFDETAGALLITESDLVLTTDSRFDVQAANEAPEYDIVQYRKGLSEALPDLVRRLGIARLGIESVRLTVQQYEKMKSALDDEEIEVSLIPVEDLVERHRVIKSEAEIEATRRALALAERAFDSIQGRLAPGMTEKQGAWELEKTMREMGADALSFPIICAAGTAAALPHAIPGDRVFESGQPLLFDWGAVLDHYCSDISRTIVLGKPDDTFRRVYATVREAQKRAIDAIGAGVSSKTVDAVAREYIDGAGYEGKFGHGLGHGTGLAVHEAPRLSPLKETTLQPGMIVTVEPGIYLPEWGGVRLENQVVVREDGAEVLNRLGFMENL